MVASALIMDPKPLEPPASFLPTRSDPCLSEQHQSSDEDDLYSRLKSLQRQLEFIDIQEEYVKDEQKNLKRELLRAQEEVKRIQSVPLVIGQFMEMVDQNNGIVGSTTGSNYYVRILSTINRELLKPSASVALHRHSNALIDVLPPEVDSSISLLSQSEKPDVTYSVKDEHQRPTGLLQPLGIPKWKLEDITMDFVVGLPRIVGQHESVWVIVDRIQWGFGAVIELK
ncbi:26S proteasome regulatory subunit 6B homolog [Humulus lupulus]|uniref:26S proteasome regulatory subunit 6B homolog n=1 Tax=Humulus lupulus TaxID=3486 RepID=UPI002B4087E7|nr:26S proteasome regulatory subunit 6B homolog [Humulus lupulus]